MRTRRWKTPLALASVIAMIAAGFPALSAAQGALDALLNQHPSNQKASASATQSDTPTIDKGPNDIRARNIFYEPELGAAPPPPPQNVAPPPPGNVAPPPQNVAPPPPAQQPQEYIGLKYKILLQGPDGNVREVPETYPFRTGMKFRMLFVPNIDGLLYIFHKGANSKGVRLFPDPRIMNGNNNVQKFQEIMIPHRGWFRFDENTGIEDLYIFVTPRKLDEFNNLQYGNDGSLPDGGWQQVTAAIHDWQSPRPDAARDLKAEGEKSEAGDRNIVYEPDTPQSPPPAQAPAVAPPSANPPAMHYTPPVVEPNDFMLNQPAPSYVVENAAMLIHHIRMEHHP